MKPRLTKRIVDVAKPGPLIRGRDLSGLGLRTTKAGTKSYVIKCRFHNCQSWLAIGRHGHPRADGGAWNPNMARKEAIALLGRAKDIQRPEVVPI